MFATYHIHVFLIFIMTQKKKITWKNILFVVLIAVLLIPQTRTPIQVAINKITVAIFSPSAVSKEKQIQLQPFTYHLKDLNNESQLVEIGKGKITFLGYWATWCPPCIAEMPSINDLYKDYGDKVQFVLITNENPEVVTNFLKKRDFQLPVFLPAMETPEQLYERSIPTSYIIDQNGRIVVKEKGASDWNSKDVRKILDGLLIDS